ncbi:NAD(P)-binding protein [Microstroma glucosiphilum]|uniref:NAD(P)-binding protein n=1 Tax=Pseudomicrostroma glucosiphilum TaxID=1684307 RepID=A0A316U3K1_9BASI|nr:NAD(P)-binding protein [Pseudomicrostroma glucosiphilum]PWN19051.1 NAD(P)-binding protein [Pseudomicrostroma glucosiphilum]
MAPATQEFFSSKTFAIAGASKDPSKRWNKVVRWYKDNDLPAIPINPKESSIEDLPSISSVSELKDAKQTSLSVITPPHVSLQIVKTGLLELGIPWIWLQPGAEDKALREFPLTFSVAVHTHTR